MCGFAGLVCRSEEVSRSCLVKMQDSLIHRGPDDAGLIILNENGRQCSEDEKGLVGLAHRRLSIIDLSTSGRQPMANEDGRIWIAYNGECYNFQKLRSDLEQCGHVFSSRTDTEVLIHGYEQWGIEGLLQQINGMFGFAIWDQNERILVLARDRVGKKPLYYTIYDKGSIVFSSEIKALIAGGFIDTEDIDETALIQFWTYGYSTGERTLFRNVRRLLPGHFAIWRDGEFVVHEYWDCVFGAQEVAGRNIDDFADELEVLLIDAIKIRLIADVPVGVFLSGGVDSSLISALTAQLTGEDIRSFSVGFSDEKYNEAGFAKTVAEHLGIENVQLQVEEDLSPFFRPIALHFDELFGDSSAIPTYFISKLTREHVTVALTGDAGDELFAGYDGYAKALSIWGKAAERKLFRGRVSLFQQLVDYYQLGFASGDQRLSALERILPLSMLKKIFTPLVFEKVSLQDAFHDREQWYARSENADLLSRLQYMNLKTYLPDDILVKVDRMSMVHALECRSPFLDYRIVEFATKLPFKCKIGPQGQQKYLLRRILSRYLPDKIINRPKMGFSIPWSEWCKGSLGHEIKNRWKSMKSPYFQEKAADILFPGKRLGWPNRQWNAFCTVNFFGRTNEKMSF